MASHLQEMVTVGGVYDAYNSRNEAVLQANLAAN
jgi:hypothetical protein